MAAEKAFDHIVGVLGVAGSITTAISLAALSLLIAFLVSRSWLQGKNAAVQKAIAGSDNDALARILGGTSVPLESLSPDQKYSLAEKELHTRAFLRVMGYALAFFAFISLLGFALILTLRGPGPNPSSSDAASPEPAKAAALTRADPIAVLGILRWVQKDRRQEVCAKLMAANECTQSEALLSSLEYQEPLPAQKQLILAAEKQGGVTKNQLQDLAACGGSFQFRIINHLLVCQDGTPVPLLSGPNQGVMAEVEGLVFHSTSSPDDQSLTSISDIVANGRPDLAGPLAQLLVSRSGAVVQIVPLNHKAFHAGASHPWNGTLVNNSNSVGVQMVNKGASSNEPFTPQQIDAAKGIAKAIKDAYGVKVIAGHSEIAEPPGRKDDPGPLFPIAQIRAANGLPNSN